MLLIFDIKLKTFVRTIKLSGLSRIMVSAKTIVAWFCMAYNKLHFVIKIWKFSSKMLGKFLSNILEKRKVSWNSELQQNSAFLTLWLLLMVHKWIWGLKPQVSIQFLFLRLLMGWTEGIIQNLNLTFQKLHNFI